MLTAISAIFAYRSQQRVNEYNVAQRELTDMQAMQRRIFTERAGKSEASLLLGLAETVRKAQQEGRPATLYMPHPSGSVKVTIEPVNAL